MTDSTPPSSSDQNLPVPVQQTTAIGRPMGGGRNLPPPKWETGEPEAVPWGQYIDALRRRWWVIVLVTVIGSAGGRYYSKTVPADFQTSIKLFVSGTGGSQGGPITQPSVLTTVTLQDMVKTPNVVAPIVRKLGLNVHFKRADSTLFREFTYDSVFTAGAFRLKVDSTGAGYALIHNPKSDAPTQETGALSDSIGRTFGFHWMPPASALKPKQIVDFFVQEVIQQAVDLTARLKTNFAEEQGQILTLVLETNDRATIAKTLNEWAAEFVKYVTVTQRANLVEKRRAVEDQLGQAKRQMDVQGAALEKFRTENILAPTENPVGASSLALDQVRLNQTHSDLQRVRGVLDGIAKGELDENRLYGSVSLMAASPLLSPKLAQLAAARQEVANLRAAGYTDAAGQVKTALANLSSIRDTEIPEILKGIERNLADSETALRGELSTRQNEILLIPQRTMEGARKQRDYDEAVKLWTSINENFQQVKLADETTSANLTIMGDAIDPLYPISSSGPRLFFLSVIASFGMGVAIALLLDRLDRRFRYPQQATMELGLTIAGTIPYFKPNRKGELNLTASAQVVESFRTLRLATQYHFPPGEPVVVCLSSPGPGEGKSLVSSNLAVAFANAGQKTLLIDGDVRRGVVHTTFEAERRPGLVDYLGGTATPAQIIRPTSTDNLFIIPSGSRSRRAPELLTSDRMAILVAEMRTQFEVVIIDSAPFVAGMDAFALGAAAGTMLVVLRPGLTDRKLAENKLELIDRLPITIIGAVLNAISGGRAYRYYSEYTTYEGEDDLQDEADFDGPSPPTPPTRLIGRR